MQSADQGGSDAMQLSWSDPRLSVASDSRRTASYRLLQSWYREQVLTARYGDYCDRPAARDRSAACCTSSDVLERPGLNFLSQDAARYARERADIVTAAGGAIDKARLARNMLSSLPMCFSIFGELRARPDRGLDVVQAFLDPQAVDVEVMECAWRPAVDVLGDRSSLRRRGDHAARATARAISSASRSSTPRRSTGPSTTATATGRRTKTAAGSTPVRRGRCSAPPPTSCGAPACSPRRASSTGSWV